ncbi:NADP-dependent oxidoreductase [Sphingobacterium sp. NGMCC 1.201703]|uniref:NADP-dependent oxidoreductase n=1 Tax=Sphingobacterium sp. NGMCC 1.201703 TaxID=3388657 RepID=UPI0039FC0869
MKAVILKKQGDVSQLELKDLPIPSPGKGEVLVKAQAIGINPTDIYARTNVALDYIFNDESPKILGWDIAGDIVELGEGVSDFAVGNAVFGLLNFPTSSSPGHGKGYAEYVVARVKDIALKPENISYQQAAAVPLAALTTWQPLNKVKIKSGDRVLITAAGGGVGHLAIQIAKSFGAYVIAIASGSKKELLMELGADEFIDYQTTNFLDILPPVDYVIEALRDEHIEQTIKVLKKGGNLLSLWNHIEGTKWEVLAKEKNVNIFYNAVISSGTDIKALAHLMGKGILRPYVSKTFKLEEMALAHQEMETNHTTGKIVVSLQ